MNAEEAPNVPAHEIAALYDLYNSTDGINWEWNRFFGGTKWNFTNPNPCNDTWVGVLCSDTLTADGELHVLKLLLSVFHLRGTLPESIANLT